MLLQPIVLPYHLFPIKKEIKASINSLVNEFPSQGYKNNQYNDNPNKTSLGRR